MLVFIYKWRKKMPFFAPRSKDDKAPLRKTPFLSNLYMKTIVLPRQARDKHRQNSKKEWRFSHRQRRHVGVVLLAAGLACLVLEGGAIKAQATTVTLAPALHMHGQG
jgi:hypothetical protein